MRSLILAACLLAFATYLAGAVSPSKPERPPLSKDGELALAHYYGVNVPQDFNKAFRHAQNGAETGDPTATVVKALCLGRGRGAAQDIDGATRLLTVLRAKNDALACAAAAVIIGQGRLAGESYPPIVIEEFGQELSEIPTYDPVERRRLVQVALSGLEPRLTSDPVACVVAGQLLSWGVAVPKNETRAKKLLLRAWELGCSDAGNQLGLIFQEGDPKHRDATEARRWFRKAADLGHAIAKINLVTFSDWSHAGSEKLAEREKLIRAAIQAGFPDASEQLGFIYWTGQGVKADLAQAREYFEQAIPSGRRESMAALGKILFDHPRNAQERLRGLQLQRQAIARGSETAANYMSWRYLKGEPGVPARPQLGFLLAVMAAESGIKDAWCAVGHAHAYGTGVAKNESQALRAFRKAIELGAVDGHFHLGIFYGHKLTPDLPAAYHHFAQGAEAGSLNAMRETGLCLLSGRGTAKDEKAGTAWVTKAAEQNDVVAKAILGDSFRFGLGVSPDRARAVSLYREAAERDYAAAMAALAVCLRDGFGGPVNLTEAVTWMRRAAEAGNPDGAIMLAEQLLKGAGLPADPDEAWKWMQMAAALGQPGACNMVADWHREGRAGPASPVEAFRWYEAAARLGSPIGTNNLGYCYQIGVGVGADPARAFALYTKAVALGNRIALINLANCYERAIGVEIDLAKAIQLRERYKKAMAR